MYSDLSQTHILYVPCPLTDPDKWSAAAMYQAVRIFVSNLKEAMAQRFFNLVLLPRVRDDISFYKRLNYHLYQALYKAMFKPAAFFKGVLLPLCMVSVPIFCCSLVECVSLGCVPLSRRETSLSIPKQACMTLGVLPDEKLFSHCYFISPQGSECLVYVSFVLRQKMFMQYILVAQCRVI